jgi:transposase
MARSLVKSTGRKHTRSEILALYDQGLKTLDVSTRLLISPAWARRVKQERPEHGKTRNATTRTRVPEWAPLTPAIKQALGEQPDLILAELQTKLGTKLHQRTLCRALQKIGLTFKKSPESGGAKSS